MIAAMLISIVGMILDIIGVWMVYKHAMPPPIKLESYTVITIPESEKPKIARHERLAKIGIFLIIAGFVLQLVSYILQLCAALPAQGGR